MALEQEYVGVWMAHDKREMHRLLGTGQARNAHQYPATHPSQPCISKAPDMLSRPGSSAGKTRNRKTGQVEWFSGGCAGWGHA